MEPRTKLKEYASDASEHASDWVPRARDRHIICMRKPHMQSAAAHLAKCDVPSTEMTGFRYGFNDSQISILSKANTKYRAVISLMRKNVDCVSARELYSERRGQGRSRAFEVQRSYLSACKQFKRDGDQEMYRNSRRH